MTKTLSALVALFAATSLFVACGPGRGSVSDKTPLAGDEQQAPTPSYGSTGASVSVHTLLGIPDESLDEARADAISITHYLSVKPQYVVSYNSVRKVPNWVSWELTLDWLGTLQRSNDFRPDDTLPSSLSQAQTSDYTGSGYDRGHLCPSADRDRNTADNSATFYLTNIVPQIGSSNRGPWERLEAYARTLAGRGDRLLITAGGIYGNDTIGTGVSVPESTFKIIVVLAPDQGANSVTAKTRVIAVRMPNREG
ncbi:MAG: DNA/RNA non-specific endonuclease, partial [Myxococcaceae bacterium]